MALKSVAITWFSGGFIVLGYAAFTWLRAKSHRRPSPARMDASSQAVQPLAALLSRVPQELALDVASEQLPANNNALPRSADLGALFLGRATEALSSVPFGPTSSEASQ